MTSIVHDIDIFGRENPDGSALEHYQEQATKNALIAWLTSKKGEYLRNPEEGGVLSKLLFKNMDDRSIPKVRFAIKNTINNSFIPQIELLGILIEPNYEQRYWAIAIKYIDLDSQTEQVAEIYTKNVSDNVSYNYENIPFKDENLRNFCLIKKSDLSNQKLLYNPDDGYWYWGKYKFTDFSQSSSNFSEILSICNI